MSEDWDFFFPPDTEALASAQSWLAGATVGIVGLGLMGGSLGLALRGTADGQRRCARVLGWSRNRATAQEALTRGCADDLCPSLADLAAKSDLLVLATPARSIVAGVREAGATLRPGSLLIDLGSTKGRIVEVMSTIPEGVGAVGGHPMCGKDIGGPAAAEAALYRGKVFVLSPTARSNPEAHARAWALALAAEGRPLPIEAERHDRLVALISHLPYLAAAAVVATAEIVAGDDPLVWQLAASGFRDTTRVAGSQLDMMIDILLTNRDAIGTSLTTLQHELAELQALLASGDEEGLRARLTAAQTKRRSLFQ